MGFPNCRWNYEKYDFTITVQIKIQNQRNRFEKDIGRHCGKGMLFTKCGIAIPHLKKRNETTAFDLTLTCV